MGVLKILSYLVLFSAVGFGLFAKYLHTTDMGRGLFPLQGPEDNFKFEDIPDLSEKVILVTGANAGLGKSTAKHLTANGATVIMACRSPPKCAAAKAEILKAISENTSEKVKKRSQQAKIDTLQLDLGSFASIKSFSESFLSKYNKLDALILNAGVMATPFSFTTDGIESQLGINHFGHFYLTQLLLPLVEKSAPSTVTVVSSNAHHWSHPEGVYLNLTAINDESLYGFQMYGQSKLANVLFAQELSERMQKSNKKVYVNSLNPGSVRTELQRNIFDGAVEFSNFILSFIPNTISYEPDWAAMTQIYCAVAPDIIQKEITGRYYVPIADEHVVHEKAKDMKLQKELWEFTERVIKDKGF